MTTKERILLNVSYDDSKLFDEIEKRYQNRSMIRESGIIAVKVLLRLDILQWNKKRLAKEMNVSPQQISKIVRGGENLTLSTIVKLEEVLGIKLLVGHSFEKSEDDNQSKQFNSLIPNPEQSFTTSDFAFRSYSGNDKFSEINVKSPITHIEEMETT